MRPALLVGLLLLAGAARAADEEDTPGEITRRQLSGDYSTSQRPKRTAAPTANVTAAPPEAQTPGTRTAPPENGAAPGASFSPSGASAPSDPAAPSEPGAAPDSGGSSSPSQPSSAGATATGGSSAKVSGVMNRMAGALDKLGKGEDGGLSPAGGGLGPAASSYRADEASQARAKEAAAEARLPPIPPGETSAVRRRPDFYRVFPKPQYEALKAAFHEPSVAAGPQAKDIALKDDLNFKWTEPCRPISGDCNKNASGPEKEKGYDKDEDVSPETLAAVLAQIRADLAAMPETGPGIKAPGIGKTFELASVMARVNAADGKPEGPMVYLGDGTGGRTAAAAAASESAPKPEAGFHTPALPLPAFARKRGVVGIAALAGAGGVALGLFWLLRRKRDSDAA